MSPFPTFRYHYLNNYNQQNVFAAGSNSNTSTALTDYSDLPDCSLSPGEGTFLAIFGGIMGNEANQRVQVSIFVNNMNQTSAVAQVEVAADWRIQMTTSAYLVDLKASDIVKVRWKVSGGTGTSYRRSLYIMRVS